MKLAIQHRLQFLVDYVYPADRGPYTADEIAGFTAKSSFKVSSTDVSNILSGELTAPNGHQLRALAQVFEVPIEFFETTNQQEWDSYVTWIKKVRERLSPAELHAARIDNWFEKRQKRRERRRKSIQKKGDSTS